MKPHPKGPARVMRDLDCGLLSVAGAILGGMKRPDLTDDEMNRLFGDALREILQADKRPPGKLIPFPDKRSPSQS